MKHRLIPAALGMLAAVAGLRAQVSVHVIDPLATDPLMSPLDPPNASGNPAFHLAAIDSGASPANLLLLFLAGSGGVPLQYEDVSIHAASFRLHVLALAYPNYPAVHVLTAGNPDPDLPEAIRRERLYGEPATDLVEVSRADCIENRLVRALQFLHASFPGEGWGSFFTGADLPEWSRVVVSGHSQGAGHAAYLAKDHALAGVVMFGGPGDFVTGAGPAPWLLQPNLTPPGRMFAFTHENDPSAAGFFLNQRILGMEIFGAVQPADGLPANQLTSHMLSSVLPVPAGNYHSAVAVDDFLPRTMQGTPVYQPIWTSMFRRVVTPTPCPGDANGDSLVTFQDVSAILADWGGTGADANGDGVVNFSDITASLSSWQQTCP
jgi:hypothetical protein